MESKGVSQAQVFWLAFFIRVCGAVRCCSLLLVFWLLRFFSGVQASLVCGNAAGFRLASSCYCVAVFSAMLSAPFFSF